MTSRSSGPNLYALLIGIDEYKSPALSTLRGCVNDVEAMRIFLTSQLDVPADHIRMLTNQFATRSRILQTFVEFLIENPDIQSGDQILFHYSGYGTQMPDTTGTEPDGLNVTLVPYDSRTPDNYDIPNKTLLALLDQLATSKGSQITIVLDCCHSGSGTPRVSDVDVAHVRLASMDERIPPKTLDLVCSMAWKLRASGQGQLDMNALRSTFAVQVSDHYQYIWEHSTV